MRTVVPARMRNASGWSDACILNISSRGLMVYAKCEAEPGSYVELRRGGELISARVIWRKNQRIGLCSPDPLSIEQIISNEIAAAPVPAMITRARIERRSQPRDPERSRARSRAMEFMSMVLIGTTLAGGAAVYAQQTLSKPLAAVQTALGSP